MPSFNFRPHLTVANRIFTDREEHATAFHEALFTYDSQRENPIVLNYFGLGGIGKTALLRKLTEELVHLNNHAIYTHINFENTDHHRLSNALLQMKKDLHQRYKIPFRSFELAYSVFWKKLNPGFIPNAKESSIPFLDEGSLLEKVISELDVVPYFSIVPPLLKKIEEAFTSHPSWSKESKEILKTLEEKSILETEDLLLYYFTEDISRHIHTTEPSYPFVIFLDSYELFSQSSQRNRGRSSSSLDWVQHLVKTLPSIIWVIGSRDKISWSDLSPSLSSYHLRELPNDDRLRFLQACGIDCEDSLRNIARTSYGVPYYLDLMVDMYQKSSQSKFVVDPLSNSPLEISRKFLYCLDLNERETLKVLAIPNFWSLDIYFKLMKEFNTGFPITACDHLIKSSFIIEEESGVWQIHPLMRKCLIEELKQSSNGYFNRRINSFMWKYYLEKLENMTHPHHIDDFFKEASFHGSRSEDLNAYIAWMIEYVNRYKSTRDLISIGQAITAALNSMSDSEQLGPLHRLEGDILFYQGNYLTSLESYNSALHHYFKLSTNTSAILETKSNMAEIYIQMSHYDKASSLLEEIISSEPQDSVDKTYFTSISLSYIRLGKLKLRYEKDNQAIHLYKLALVHCENGIKLYPGSTTLYANMGLAYEKLGEAYGSEKSLARFNAYLHSLKAYEQSMQHITDENDYWTIVNYGMVHKRLAEYYQDPELKDAHFIKAIQMYDQVLKKSSTFVECLEKKGHALVDYMIHKIDYADFEMAETLFTQAVNVFETIEQLSPYRASSRNRHASLYTHFSRGLMKQHKYESALSHLHQSLHLYEQMLEYTPDYIYLNNSLQRTHQTLGDVYDCLGDTIQSTSHYQLAATYTKSALNET
ncbi:hypothetical protein [Exiguobacterium sp. SH0S2]|uniref:hypothetical protein n=1 Tax=Exiguobacterium sp. SH0S2 TaxID=2510950 RepID=UPI0010404F97|nr:hypothetical protein [Exiguobacterium sp. SH0S2]TCI63155.1 hypothetical protein EVJ21_06480 [Exiguobacterium sp. SH0S2]